MTLKCDPTSRSDSVQSQASSSTQGRNASAPNRKDTMASSLDEECCFSISRCLLNCFTQLGDWICCCFDFICGSNEPALARSKRASTASLSPEEERRQQLKEDGRKLMAFRNKYHPDGQESFEIDQQQFMIDFNALSQPIKTKLREAIWEQANADRDSFEPIKDRRRICDRYIRHHPAHALLIVKEIEILNSITDELTSRRK